MIKFLFLLGLFSFFYPLTLSSNPQFEVGASYLYWGASEDQLTFALENASSFATGAEMKPVHLKTHRPSWNSGVRINAGYINPLSKILFSWTHFQTQSHAHANDVLVTAISGQLNDTPFFPAAFASSRWKLQCNEYALDLFRLNSMFQPYVGLLGARVHQHQKIDYFHAVSKASDDFNISVLRKNQFWGLGPRLGVDFIWNLFNELSFNAGIDGAYLLGRFNTKNIIFTPPELMLEFSPIISRQTRGRPMIDGRLGLQWYWTACHFIGELSLSYEYQYWWRQWHNCSNLFNDLISGEGAWGDLSLQGLVASINISY